ncbi:MAG: DMT family transporter [Gammaproteobacteria bacterium]|nr:DMT family transporter [Gammaproteobacteria bacterium]
MSAARANAVTRDNHRHGIYWMLLTMFLFVSMDTVAKYLTGFYSVSQIVWARYVFHVALLFLWLGPRLPSTLRTRRLGLQLARSLLLLLTTFFFFTGLSFMPMVDASVIMFVGPIVLTVLAALILGERIRVRRWVSVLVGFVGALIVIRPGTSMMQPAAVFPFAAACCYALYQIATRKLAGYDAPLTTLAYTALVGAVLCVPIAPFAWTWPDLEGWFLMVLVGLIGGLGHFCLIKSLDCAPAAVVAPFGYTSIVWSTSLGFLVFGDLPDGWTLTGGAIIIASGIYILHRERVRGASKAAPLPAGSDGDRISGSE